MAEAHTQSFYMLHMDLVRSRCCLWSRCRKAIDERQTVLRRSVSFVRMRETLACTTDLSERVGAHGTLWL